MRSPTSRFRCLVTNDQRQSEWGWAFLLSQDGSAGVGRGALYRTAGLLRIQILAIGLFCAHGTGGAIVRSAVLTIAGASVDAHFRRCHGAEASGKHIWQWIKTDEDRSTTSTGERTGETGEERFLLQGRLVPSEAREAKLAKKKSLLIVAANELDKEELSDKELLKGYKGQHSVE